jgi:murein DD-endopeptidase MepM/ murein hydrolase activator NlpD
LFKSFFILTNRFVITPLLFILKPLYTFLILPLYQIILKANKRLDVFLAPVKNKYLIPFVNRYVSHIIILLITISIVTLNYQVKETRAESFGERSILYALVHGGDFDDLYIEETIDPSQEVGRSYLEDQVLGATPAQQRVSAENTIIETEVDQNTVAITQGGAVAPTGITSIEASKKKRDKIINYEVKSGDTVSGIAAQFGISTNTLLWANDLTSRSYLKPGQNLDIPPVSGIVYTVKSGDNLSKIAQRYDTELDDIITFNKLADASDIQLGQVLMLPGGSPYQAPAPVQPTKLAPVEKIFTNDTSNQKPTGTGRLIWPTSTRRISQYYHWRHTALDIDGEFGDLIWSSGAGTVVRVEYLTYDYGYYVIVDHGGGMQTLYAHFQRIYVQPGQKVNQGDVLGEMGSTGRSTGSHLHYEVRVNGSRLNPFSWVSGY